MALPSRTRPLRPNSFFCLPQPPCRRQCQCPTEVCVGLGQLWFPSTRRRLSDFAELPAGEGWKSYSCYDFTLRWPMVFGLQQCLKQVNRLCTAVPEPSIPEHRQLARYDNASEHPLTGHSSNIQGKCKLEVYWQTVTHY